MMPRGLVKRAAAPLPSALPCDAGLAGQGGDPSGGRDLADGEVEVVGDVEVAGSVAGDAAGRVEARRGAAAVDSSLGAGLAGECGDLPGGRDLADGAVAGIGDVEVAGSVADDALGVVEARRGACAVGAAGGAGLAGQGGDHAARDCR